VDSTVLNNLRSRSIPKLGDAPNYSRIKVDVSDNRIEEPLIDIRNLNISGSNYYNSYWNPPYHHTAPYSISDLFVRKEVANKLIAINSKLRQTGLELHIWDAYRPIALQNYFFRVWMPDFFERQHPEKGIDWAKKETAKFWAPGATDIGSILLYPPPHGTGGAIDLTIRVINGFIIEMGGLFDDLCDRSRSDFFELTPPTNFTENEAQKNRRILYNVMVDEGFVPHPLEWWHFSYGDRLWAATTGIRSFYSYANIENLDLHVDRHSITCHEALGKRCIILNSLSHGECGTGQPVNQPDS